MSTIPPSRCPKCRSAVVIKSGRFGKFFGCSTYPKCTWAQNVSSPKVPTEDEMAQSKDMMDVAFAFVRRCGSVEQAKYWIDVISQLGANFEAQATKKPKEDCPTALG